MNWTEFSNSFGRMTLTEFINELRWYDYILIIILFILLTWFICIAIKNYKKTNENPNP